MKALHLKFTRSSLLLIILIIVSSCRSPQKMVESGEYDRAVAYVVKKLEGKSKKKEKFVRSLEEAFEKATRRDMQYIAALKDEGLPHNWQEEASRFLLL